MNLFQHGEVYVTAETDLDIGYYERFLDASSAANVTTGQIYQKLRKERAGEYLGQCVQDPAYHQLNSAVCAPRLMRTVSM